MISGVYLECRHNSNRSFKRTTTELIISPCDEFSTLAFDDLTLGYDSAKNDNQVLLSNYFKHAGSTCPTQSCEMKEAGCQATWAGQSSDMVLGGSAPNSYRLYIDMSSVGFQYTICFDCSNGFVSKNIDNIIIKQC